jgi:hypothetical protein
MLSEAFKIKNKCVIKANLQIGEWMGNMGRAESNGWSVKQFY